MQKHLFETILSDKPVLPRSDIYYISKLESNHYMYQKIYRIRQENIKLIFEPYGRYMNGHFSKFNPMLSGLEKRRNLQGKLFQGVTLLQDKGLLRTFRTYR